jgi:signal transduction histidine kinase
VPARDTKEGDRMRQILHELRTPVNAIQGFAEVIQQQLFGPTPHEYRALAATVAGDAARMLAGFEELDRLVKLDAGALVLDPGECDLLPVLSATIAQLEAFHAPRRSGLELDWDEPTLLVTIARTEAERLIWRLLTTLSGATAPNEVLHLRARRRGDAVRLVLRLPASLAWCDDDALLHVAPGAQPPALAAGMFGIGFALRLAAAEARAAGGWLDRREQKLRLSLPAVTAADRSVGLG